MVAFFLFSLFFSWFFVGAFYVLYISAINLWHYRDQISRVDIVVAFPYMLLMIIIDVSFQWTIANFIFWDLAKEMTLSQRLERYRTSFYDNSFRQKIANFICTKALNPFDPTKKHC